MAKQFIFVNTDGDYEQGGNTFEEVDFVSVSAGEADASKPLQLNTSGLIDASVIDASAIDHGSLGGLDDDDHQIYLLADGTRSLTGIITYTGSPSFNNDNELVNKKYTDDIVAALGTGMEWQDSCIDQTGTPPSSPNAGDRYLITTGTGAWVGYDNHIAEWNGSSWDFTSGSVGTYTSVDDVTDAIFFYNGSSWVEHYYESTTASLGVQKVGMDIRADLLAGGGIKLSGNSMEIEPNDFAGDGLIDDGSDNLAVDWATNYTIDGADAKAIPANDLASTTNGFGAAMVGIEDASGYYTGTSLETVLDEIEGQLGGSTSTTYSFTEDNVLADNDSVYSALDKLDQKWGDLASTANAEGASIVGIEDAGSYTSQTDVEGAIQEIYEKLLSAGQTYTVDGVGVTKGDLVYISANDTVSTHATISNAEYVIGVAATTVGAGGTVTVLANDTILTGVLGGSAAAGTKYYWNGSGYTTNFAGFSSGDYIWQGGVAKNGNDVSVEVEFIMRKA